jgi:hypothetical protein
MCVANDLRWRVEARYYVKLVTMSPGKSTPAALVAICTSLNSHDAVAEVIQELIWADLLAIIVHCSVQRQTLGCFTHFFSRPQGGIEPRNESRPV